MKKSTNDTATINFKIDDLAKQNLPRLLDIKEKVDLGGKLSESDIQFMSQVIHYSQRSRFLINQFPEWQRFFTELLHLHGEIVNMAMDNK